MEEDFKRLRERLNLEAQIRAAVQKDQLQSAPPVEKGLWMMSGIAVVVLLALAGILFMALSQPI